MHLQTHIKQCIIDYGSVYGFWFFPFERYNGMLGSIRTNNKVIESYYLLMIMNSVQSVVLGKKLKM